MADINVTEEIIDINVTEEVVNIIAPSGGYPLPNTINSVFGRVGNIVATEGDYTLTQLGDVTLTSPANGQVLKYNGTQWANSTDADTGITTLNTLTALSQTFATGSSGTDFNISSATSTHTFNFPTASATNRGLLSSADWSTFNAKQNALTNPVTGTGTTNTLPKFTGASTIGNSNVSDSGTLITLGSNSSINGQLVIGGSIEAGFNLIVNKTITGGVNAIGVYQKGIVQSDVTGVGFGFNNQLGTQATTFTISQYRHYSTNQQTLGAGSSIGTQIGFQADNTLTGATNNYGFRGLIPSGTNRWNLYMDGTAANYLAGDTGIGTQTLGTATQLTIGGTETAVSAISRGQLINTNLVASANGDNLVGLDIQSSLSVGSFTGLQYSALRVNGNILLNSNSVNIVVSPNGTGTTNESLNFNAARAVFGYDAALGGAYISTYATRPISFLLGSSTMGRFFATTGNFTLQNGGTFTDAGFRLDVNGTTRFIGTASSDTAPLGSELAAVTGTGTNWTLAGTNLNVGGYTHTTGSVDPLTTALAAVNGTYYQIAYNITGRTAGTITIAYGGTSTTVSATGATGPLASSTAVLTITPTTDFNGTVVLSIKTIIASPASSTFSNSTLASNIEFRASNIILNTFIGLNAGRRNTTGNNNTFVGSQNGINNTTGAGNTFIGTNSGQNNTTGINNTFIGLNAGTTNLIGLDNTFLGVNTGVNTTASFNTFIGTFAGANNTTGTNNNYVGRSAGINTTTGSNNIMFGSDAGRYLANGTSPNVLCSTSIFIGHATKAAADNQTNQIVIGTGTTGLGSNTTIIGNSSTVTTALYGDLLLGTTTPSTATILTVSGTETASSAIARGGLINTTLVAAANNDNLIALDIAPTFTNGAFTGVNNFGLRVSNITSVGNLAIGLLDNFLFTIKNFTSPRTITINPQSNLISASDGLALNHNSIFTIRNNNVTQFHMFANGNIILQNGGTFTDAGFRLDVQGTARITQNLTVPNIYSRNIYSDTVAGISILSNGGTRWSQWFESTGNLQIQNGGTFTDIASARLAVNSTTQGFLPPRMTTTQKLAIATPASGLMVYDTTLNQMSYYNGTLWINF